jgi:hypothetical protein
MNKIIVSKIITDTSHAKSTFAVPDIVELMRMYITVGEEVYIPVNIRKNEVTFWETGGRNDKYVSSLGTIISGSNDELLDAILFNKLNKQVNGKHALIALRPGYHIYAGKISVRHNTLSPKIKIFRLVYLGIDDELSDDPVTTGIYGQFVIDKVYTSVSDTVDCTPASRLVTKLFTKQVMRPYYVNGWSFSEIKKLSNVDILNGAYIDILSDDTKAIDVNRGDDFLDKIEDNIISIGNNNLSSALMWLDFNTGKMGIKTLNDVRLSNIIGTIRDASVMGNFTIDLADMLDAYNTKLLFDTDDLDTLRMALKHDDIYTIELYDDVFVLLLAYRG